MTKKLIFAFSISTLLFMTGCSGIDKAMHSVANGVSSYDMVTGQRTLNIRDRASQIRLTDPKIKEAISKEYTSKGKAINADLDAHAYTRLLEVFQRVKSVSHVAHEDWTVFLLPENDFNAFVAGGSTVVVFMGLMKDLKSDAELAAVLGHELSHVTANHVFEREAHTLAAKANNSSSINQGSFNAAFTHKGEEEADKVGILYAALAGYDPYAAKQIWERQYKKKGNGGAFFRSHPIHSERIENTEAIAAKAKAYYQKGKKNPNYQEILRNNSIYKTYFDQQEPEAGKGGGFIALLSASADAYGRHLEAKNEEMRQATHIRNINTIQKYYLKITNVQKITPRVDRVTFLYTGDKPLKNVTLYGASQKERIVVRPTGLWHKNYTVTLDFKFNETNVFYNKIIYGLDNAEW